MSIGAIGGVGGIGSDYSWYTPGSAGKVQDNDSFDLALDAVDDTADAADAADDIANVAEPIATKAQNVSQQLISAVEESGQFSRDRMGQGFSDMRVSMEDLQMAAIGFHTKHRFELLGL